MQELELERAEKQRWRDEVMRLNEVNRSKFVTVLNKVKELQHHHSHHQLRMDELHSQQDSMNKEMERRESSRTQISGQATSLQIQKDELERRLITQREEM